MLAETSKKDRLVQFKMTNAEYERMKTHVEKKGSYPSISDFIREAITQRIDFQEKFPHIQPPVFNIPPTKGLGIWLLPSTTSITEIEKISRFSAGFLLQNDSVWIPTFHITLISGISGDLANIIEKSNELVSFVTKSIGLPLHAYTGGIRWSKSSHPKKDYYQCLYFDIKFTEKLFTIYKSAQQVFENLLPEKKEAFFYSHLSIIYGFISELEKAGLEERINKGWDTDFMIEIDKIRLMKLDGTPDQWEVISDFDLS